MTVADLRLPPKTHRHEFSGLWWHFGQYGRQDVHIHSCFVNDDCERVLIGDGWDCDGDKATHHREWLR